jgi:cytochrome c oxidase subunit 2
MEINPYEKTWIGITITAVVFMLIAVGVASFGFGLQLPGASGSLNPQKLAQQPPFDKPGVYEVAPGKYEVVMLAFTWAFDPAAITIPAGSEVTFKVTSRDVTHGLYIEGTDLNAMILPGQITTLKHKFNTPGTYQFYCDEYCGASHQAMMGKIIVEP